MIEWDGEIGWNWNENGEEVKGKGNKKIFF
jgi:hypothetical protein